MKRAHLLRWWIPALLAALVCAACSSPPVRQASTPPAAPVAAAEPAPRAAVELKPAPVPLTAPSAVSKGVAPSAGADELANARKSYEEGAYAAAAKRFQAALDLGLAQGDELDAHKHLAFIACAAHRRTKCRAEFKKAFDVDPAVDLTPAEAGHPLWGPTFRNVKRQVQAPQAAKGR
jgi:hypothetical protein